MVTKLNRTQEKLDINKRRISLPTKLPAEVRKQQKTLIFFPFVLCFPKIPLDLITAPVKTGQK